MRHLLPAVLIVAFSLPAIAEEAQLSKDVKASLVFRKDTRTDGHYPHVLRVFLRLENVRESDVSWVTNGRSAIEAELLDSAGKRVVHRGFVFVSVQSSFQAYRLPIGSRLDWLISHGGVTLLGSAKDDFALGAEDKYALIVGCRGWMVPIETAGTYSLRIRLRGHPWRDEATADDDVPKLPLLLDLPPAKIKVVE